MIRFALRLVLLFALVALVGCQGSNAVRQEQAAGTPRNQQRAAELTQQATQLIDSDPHEAMRLLRLAIDADLFHGPAHNNIGVILLNRGDLYEAAEEFDWARRLMPGHPDPRINLGLALERGGKVEEALDAYASAIEVYPNHLPAVQALARLQIRSGQIDDGTQELLAQIRQRGNEEWRVWANGRLMGR